MFEGLTFLTERLGAVCTTCWRRATVTAQSSTLTRRWRFCILAASRRSTRTKKRKCRSNGGSGSLEPTCTSRKWACPASSWTLMSTFLKALTSPIHFVNKQHFVSHYGILFIILAKRTWQTSVKSWLKRSSTTNKSDRMYCKNCKLCTIIIINR